MSEATTPAGTLDLRSWPAEFARRFAAMRQPVPERPEQTEDAEP